MKKTIHPLAGALGFLTIATFWLATVASELFGSQATVVAVKTAIPWGFLVLIPALAVAGGSGLSMTGSARAGLAGLKAKRMRIVAANGVLILVPAAFLLSAKATAGTFDATFFAVQALELLAGATNLALLGLNLRDGLRMTGRLRRRGRRDPA